MTERHDRILDACLEEVLAEQSPPDLSERILQALATRTSDASAAGLPGDAPRPLRPAPVVLRECVSPVLSSSTRSGPPAWMLGAIAATLLALVAGYSLARWWRPHAPDQNVVQQPQTAPAADIAREDAARPPIEAPVLAPVKEETPVIVASPPRPKPEVIVNSPSVAPTPPVVKAENVTPERPSQAAGSTRSDEEILAEINALVRVRWATEGVKPATLATDAEWCRRVYLDIVGRVPTLGETNRYLAERGQQKRSRLVERLLDSDTGVEEYARNWTNIWTALLIGRSSQPGSLANREGMQQYLRRALLRNKPYDEFVAELVSADGANTPGAEGFNGAVNFVLDNLQENAVPATAKTARLFLGMQVQCTQCHNHPFNDWKQSQFWDLNSFFRQAKAETNRGMPGSPARLTDVDFAGDGEIYWEMRNGLMKTSYPVFVDGTAIASSGAIEKVNRRDELARLITRAPEMPRALVNRLWSHFLGYGFTRPVDDMGPHNVPSHPELLELLANEFSVHGHDLKRLIRWIALSEVYSLSSRVPAITLKEGKDDPIAGTPPLFSYFYVRQMRAEELYESLLTFTGKRGTGTFEEQQRAKNQWLEQFTGNYATEENDEYTTFNGSITQTLMMFNGDLMRDASRVDRSTFLRSVAVSDDKPNVKIGQVFLAALGRKPSAGELQMAHQLWLDRKQDGNAALQDIWWAVLNSNEFIMNH